jgi:hypothetical protein
MQTALTDLLNKYGTKSISLMLRHIARSEKDPVKQAALFELADDLEETLSKCRPR